MVGVIGTVLSALGVLQYFTGFLTLLGVTIPPVAGIIVVDYFVLRSHRRELDESRTRNMLPSFVASWNPVAILVWIVASIVGYVLQWGIPALNSLFCSAILYYLLMKGLTLAQSRSKQQRQPASVSSKID